MVLDRLVPSNSEINKRIEPVVWRSQWKVRDD